MLFCKSTAIHLDRAMRLMLLAVKKAVEEIGAQDDH
jgi:hypothetical protein